MKTLRPRHATALFALVAALLAVKNLFALGIVRLQSRFIAAKEAELARRLFDAYVRGDSETLAALPPEERFSDLTRINRLCHQVLLPGLQAAADTLVVAALCLTALVLFPPVTAGGAAVLLLAAAADPPGRPAARSGVSRAGEAGEPHPARRDLR